MSKLTAVHSNTASPIFFIIAYPKLRQVVYMTKIFIIMQTVPEESVRGCNANSSASAGNMGEESRISASGSGVRSRPGQRLAIPLHLLPEWRRLAIYKYKYFFLNHGSTT